MSVIVIACIVMGVCVVLYPLLTSIFMRKYYTPLLIFKETVQVIFSFVILILSMTVVSAMVYFVPLLKDYVASEINQAYIEFAGEDPSFFAILGLIILMVSPIYAGLFVANKVMFPRTEEEKLLKAKLNEDFNNKLPKWLRSNKTAS